MNEPLTDTAPGGRSTILDDDATPPSGAGQQVDDGTDKGQPEPESPKTRRDALEAAAEQTEKENAREPESEKEPERAAEEVKAEKPAKAAEEGETGPQKAGTDEETDSKALKTERQPSDPRYKEPPRSLTARGREVWANTPNAVKADVLRMERDYENVIAETRQVKQAWEKLAPFDDMARKGGTTLDVALSRYVELEQTLRENPIKGIDAVLKNINPQFSLEGFVQQLAQNPGLIQHAMGLPSARPQPEPVNPELEQWRARAEELERKQFETTVIAPFAKDHPRFEELQEHIVNLLNSGMIPKSSDPLERLEIAYDMACRIVPLPKSENETFEEPVSKAPVPRPSPGRKSISGAPSPGMKSPAVRGKTMSRRAALEAAMAGSGG